MTMSLPTRIVGAGVGAGDGAGVGAGGGAGVRVGEASALAHCMTLNVIQAPSKNPAANTMIAKCITLAS